MRYSNTFKLTFLILLLFCFKFLVARDQVLFFSQDTNITQKNFLSVVTKISKYHQIISLIGTYDLIDKDKDQFIGRVSVPSIFHKKESFVFRRSFDKIDSSDYTYWLHFERVVGYLMVKVNGQSLYKGSHNFIPLKIKVPPKLLLGSDNILEITLEPWSLQQNQLPPWSPLNFPRIDNGIYGAVYLEGVPDISISEVFISPKTVDDITIIQVDISIELPRKSVGNFFIQCQLKQNNIKILHDHQLPLQIDTLSSLQKFSFEFKYNQLKPWSVEQPTRYSMHFDLFQDGKVCDSKEKQIAIREPLFKLSHSMQDKRPLQLMGLNYVYQNTSGVSLYNKEIVIKDLQTIKSRGFNTIRVGHFPLSPNFYQITDSLGLICFQDLPFPLINDWIPKDSLAQKKLLEYARKFIELASEHPSLFGIGIGLFYEPESEKILKVLAAIKEMASSYQIPLLYGSFYDPSLFKFIKLDGFFLEVLERNNQEQLFNKLHGNLPKNRPVFISGFYKAISYRVDSSAITHDLMQITELYQRINSEVWRENFVGNLALTFSDYFLETPALQAGPENNFRLNTIGIYDVKRNAKPGVFEKLSQNWKPLRESSVELEKRQFGTYIFIIIGLINFFVFLIIFRSFIEFRKNLYRTIRRPHGFFVEVNERRMISYEQSFYLIFILSVNAAVMIGGILYFFRNNLFLDYLLSLIFLHPQLKLYAISLIWEPITLVPALTILIIFIFLLLAIPIKIVSIFREPKVRLRQALAVSTWAGAPFIILLPFGMFFYNLLVVMNSYWILFIVLLYFHVWYFVRWLNGARVMALITYARVFVYTCIFILIVCGGLFYYLQDKIQIIRHIKFLYHLFHFYI